MGPSDRTRGNRHQFKNHRIPSEHKKTFFFFYPQLSTVLVVYSSWPCSEQGRWTGSPEASNLNYSVILPIHEPTYSGILKGELTSRSTFPMGLQIWLFLSYPITHALIISRTDYFHIAWWCIFCQVAQLMQKGCSSISQREHVITAKAQVLTYNNESKIYFHLLTSTERWFFRRNSCFSYLHNQSIQCAYSTNYKGLYCLAINYSTCYSENGNKIKKIKTLLLHVLLPSSINKTTIHFLKSGQ